MPYLIVAVSIVIALGRFTVPGHTLSYAGSYEAIAHIWVGMLLVWCNAQPRWVAIGCVCGITALEVVIFVLR